MGSGAMGRYYFDMRDSRGLFPDEEGAECRDIDAAQDEAARALTDMARDSIQAARHVFSHQMSIEVRDDAGPVMKVRFAFEVIRQN